VDRKLCAYAPHACPLKQRPDIGAAVAASLTGKSRLKLGQPHVIAPLRRVDHD
jgi:hypothetical protein